MRTLIASTLIAVAAAMIYFTPQTPDEPQPKQAVFGRTMCPTWPYCGTWDGHIAVTHLSDPPVL